jgi:acetyl-CoA synthetase
MMAGGDGDGDAVFEPLTALCNIVRDPASGGLRIRIPEFANIALDTVSRHARGERAGALALVCEDGEGALERFTYADLDAASDRLAVGLTGLGVGRGNAVAVHTGQSSATAIAHLAIYKLGAVVMTLSHLYGPDTVMHALTDSRVRVLISDPAAWQPLRGRRHELADLDHVIMSGAAEGDELALAPLLATDATGFQPVRTRADEPALLMYTSGSTGLPKGLMHAHRIIHAYLPTLTLVYNLELAEPGHVFWTPADWAWVGGLLDLVLPAWQCGQTVIASPAHRFEADWAFAFMARHRVSHAFMTPTALKRLAEVPRPRERWDLAVRVVCTGGESLPGDVVRWAQEGFGIVCNEFYGLTEFNHMVGCCKALYPVLPGSMGRAYPGRRVAIIDENGNEQPDGTVGEIASWCPDEPTLFLGYRGAPGVPPHMRHGEWLRSGDLALRDADGYFWYQGRGDDLIKSAGYRIGPAEVEDALVRHPSVAEAAVVGKPDPRRGSIVKAFVRVMPGVDADAALSEELTAFVKTNLAAYKAPREIEYVDAFPLTSSGKIRRKALRELS